MRAMGEGRRGSNVSQVGPSCCVDQIQAVVDAVNQNGFKSGEHTGQWVMREHNKRMEQPGDDGWMSFLLLVTILGNFRMVEKGVERMTASEVDNSPRPGDVQGPEDPTKETARVGTRVPLKKKKGAEDPKTSKKKTRRGHRTSRKENKGEDPKSSKRKEGGDNPRECWEE